MFEIGDLVDVTSRSYPVYGKIIGLTKDGRWALVSLRIPRRPMTSGICDECGSMNLSMDSVSGEIVCMRTGCGHSCGFDEVLDNFALNDLVNISEQRRNERRAQYKKDLEKTLWHGVKDRLITIEQVEAILKLV